MTLEEWRVLMADVLANSPDAGRIWDVMTALRGPDAPSERTGMSSKDYNAAYSGRRDRKFKTVEVIRHAAFGGYVGGGARHHKDTKVIVRRNQDHFDRHVIAAARALGLRMETEDE